MNIKMNRRVFASAAALAVMAPKAFAQAAPDLTKLNEPPALGELVIGKEDAKVTIIEYASASCPHCATFANDELPKFKEYLDSGKVKILFREFPLNDAAMGGFMLARCAPKEKQVALIEVLFKTQAKWVQNPLEGLKEIALQAGFTNETFMACLNNKDIAEKILAERTRADGFGIDSVPFFFINGKKYDGATNTFDDMKKVIDPLLG
jgi:protein-disulfide isomerase